MSELIVNAISQSGGSPTGVILASNQNGTYANAQAGTGAASGQPFGIEVGQNSGSPFLIYRNGLSFDTSALGVNAGIISAILSVYGFTDYSVTDFNLTLVSGADLDTLLVDADFQELLNDTSSLGSTSTSGFLEGAWFNIALNAAGLAAINKTGITRFGLRSSRDISATAPTGLESIQYETPWVEGWPTTHRPKLDIIYGNYPTDPLLRASGIERNFWAGIGGNSVYEATLTLGGISSTYVSPVGERQTPGAVQSTPPPTGAGFQEADYLRWLSRPDISDDEIFRIFGHFPTYADWVAAKKSGRIK